MSGLSTPKGDDMKQIEGQMSIFQFIPSENHDFNGKPDYQGKTDEIQRLSIETDFTRTITLRKCSCGGKAENYFQGCYTRFVRCTKCGKRTEMFRHQYEAMQAWNRGEVIECPRKSCLGCEVPKCKKKLQEAAEHEEKLTPKKYEIGEWVEEHGKRVLFKDIQVNKCYIADYSTVSHKWLKVVYVKWIKGDSVGYVDSPRGVKADWSWGNSFCALTREEYVNRECDPEKGEAESFEWWYELPSEDQKETTKEIVYKVDISGLCDDAYCSNCGDCIDEKEWLDSERCPYCNVKISWEPWHRANDEEMQNLFGENWHERFGRKLRNEGKDIHESD